MPRIAVAGRMVILVDDGIATSPRLEATIAALSQERIACLVVALPGGAPDALDRIARIERVDEVVALARPRPFHAVGQLYDAFDPVSSEKVYDALRRHRAWRRQVVAAGREEAST